MKFIKILILTVFTTIIFIGCDEETNAASTSFEQNIVVEVTTFQLNDDVDANTFEARDAEIEEQFASKQPGFLKRMSGVDAEGKYVVMVFWETLADADASISAFQTDSSVGDYFAMINVETFSAERYTTFSVPNIDFSLKSDYVIEITTFNINSGVDSEAFKQRDGEIEADFASKQPGFIRRTSGVDANGKYAVIVFWESLKDADNSIAAFQQDASVADYFAMINGETFAAQRFTVFIPPLTENSTIKLRNTLQDPEEEEATYASLFGQPDDAFDELSTLSNDEAEFPTALAQTTENGAPFDISGLYHIDFTTNSIHFRVLPNSNDTFWSKVLGVFPKGKFDRYYFTFNQAHNVTGFTSDNPYLNVRIDSETVLVVELKEGYDLKPNVKFSVKLK